jgi:ABC-2 type transport system permease protein
MLLRTWAMARKELIQIWRDPRTLSVVLVMPFVMLVIYGYAIKTDVHHLRTAVLDQDHSSTSRDFLRSFTTSEYFDLLYYVNTSDEIDPLLDSGRVKLGVVIPEGFARDLAAGRTVQIQVLVDGSDPANATIASAYVSGLVQTYSGQIMVDAAARQGLPAALVTPPVDFEPRVWYNPDLKSTYFIVPGLMAVILMMLSALLTAMTVVRERERGTIEQLVVSPVRPAELMVGKLLPYVGIAFMDVVLVLVCGQLLFHVPLRGSTPLLLGLSTVYLVAALGLGLFISTVSQTQQAAMVVAMMGTQLPSLLLSGFVFPVMNMPVVIRVLTYLIPARYYLVIVRGIFLKGVGMHYLWRPTLFLLAFGVIVLGLSILRFKKTL